MPVNSVKCSDSSSLAYEHESFMVAGTTATVLFITGEIDIATDGRLNDALVELLNRQSANFVVDLIEVRFCSVGGFAMIAGAARSVGVESGSLAIVSRSIQIARLCATLWPDRPVPCHRTVTAALTEIRWRLASRRSSFLVSALSAQREVRV